MQGVAAGIRNKPGKKPRAGTVPALFLLAFGAYTDFGEAQGCKEG